MSRVLALRYDPKEKQTELFFESGRSTREKGRPEGILNRWCIQCGSTMQGRIDAVKAVTGIRSKVPLVIGDQGSVIFFPILSSRSTADNYWINDSMLVTMKADQRIACDLYFAEGTVLTVPFDIRILKRQRNNCRTIRETFRTLKRPEEVKPADLLVIQSVLKGN